MSDNPYQAPEANIQTAVDATEYQPELISVRGRIGRLRYLAYGLFGMVIAIPLMLIIFGLGVIDPTMFLEDEASSFRATIIFYLALSPVFIWSFIVGARRFNDLNISGWWVLAMILPLVNTVIALILLLWPGTKGVNNYGPQPTANSGGVKAVAWIVIGLMVIGFGAGFFAAMTSA